MFRFAHLAMGTTFEIMLDGVDKKYTGQVSQAVFTEIDRLESLFTRFNPGSEIGQINRLQPGQSFTIGVETFDCLQTALCIQARTGGAFDVNIGEQLDLQDKSGKENRLAKIDILEQMKLSHSAHRYSLEILPAVGMTGIQEAHEAQALFHTLNLDLGGIGKGFALDKALDLLADWDVESALLHGGTSTALAVGAPSQGQGRHKGWPVAVGGDWNCPQIPEILFLKDRALSGSGTEVKGSHIIDPRTGKPAAGHAAAWVSHPSAAVADALSTAFIVMNSEEVGVFCEYHPDVWALVIIDSHTCEEFNPELREFKGHHN